MMVDASPETVQFSVSSAPRSGHVFELTKLFLVATDSVGKKLDRGAKVINLSRESGESAGIDVCGTILINDGAKGWIAIETRATDAREDSDAHEGDRLRVSVQL